MRCPTQILFCAAFLAGVSVAEAQDTSGPIRPRRPESGAKRRRSGPKRPELARALLRRLAAPQSGSRTCRCWTRLPVSIEQASRS